MPVPAVGRNTNTPAQSVGDYLHFGLPGRTLSKSVFLNILRGIWSVYSEKVGIEAPLKVGQVFLKPKDVRSLLITSSFGDYPFYFLSNVQIQFLEDSRAFELWKSFLEFLGIPHTDTIYDMDEDYKLYPIGSLRKPLNNLSAELGLNREIHLPEIYRVFRFVTPPFLYMGATPYYVVLLSVKYLKSREGKEEVPEKTREYMLKLIEKCVLPDAFSNMPYMQKLQLIREEDFLKFKEILVDIGYSDFVPFVEEAEDIAKHDREGGDF